MIHNLKEISAAQVHLASLSNLYVHIYINDERIYNTTITTNYIYTCGGSVIYSFIICLSKPTIFSNKKL